MTLVETLAANVRPYRTALAHRIANTRGSEADRMLWLNGLFAKMPDFERVVCRIEIAECRAAKRGERLARVA